MRVSREKLNGLVSRELRTTQDRGLLHDQSGASCFNHHACSDVWDAVEAFHHESSTNRFLTGSLMAAMRAF